MIMSKVAVVTGASRGIGRIACHALAKNGYHIIIAAKSINENEKLPGTIYSVQKEIKEKYNVESYPIKMNVRDCQEMRDCINDVAEEFGRIDVLFNNAGALWWESILKTPPKKFDLINDVNVRASFILSHLCIPHMQQHGGHIIMHSPPLDDVNTNHTYKNKTGYMISKYGMTMTAMGISEEFKNKGIAANTIWPATPIKSFATKNNDLGTEKHWRKPDIIADAILEIVREDPKIFTGNQLIDEEYLRTKGIQDFAKYRCVENHEPPSLKDIFLL